MTTALSLKHVGVLCRREGTGVGTLLGIARYARETRRLRYSLFDHVNPTNVSRARKAGIDGVIAYIASATSLPLLRRLGIPIVNVSNYQLHMDVPSVVQNNEMIGELAADHLLRTGLRHMACQLTPKHEGMRCRAESFRNRIVAAGRSFIALPIDFIPDPGTPATDALDARRLLRLPSPLGILAGTDRDADSIIRIARMAGLKVPADIAIVGVDNLPDVCEHAQPPITSVDPSSERIGYEAARLVDLLMSGEPAPAHAIIVPPIGVVARASSDVLAIEDADLADAVRFIRENAFQSVSIPDILKRINLSRRSLERRIRQELGHSLHDEIMTMRMSRADELLRVTNLPIAKIAHMCGFRSQGYFTRAVRQRLGHTPAVIRSQTPRHPAGEILAQSRRLAVPRGGPSLVPKLRLDWVARG